MQSIAAAITMVRDDAFFLERWVAHYGGQFGRENCYVISHGRGEETARIAEGCNLIGIPGEAHRNFDMKRWRLLNGLQAGLRAYYKYVIVGDVDEYVVMDPAEGASLLDYLGGMKARRILTPLGLEVLHMPGEEPDPITGAILGPRRFARVSMHYSKPCVISQGTRLSRGGHFAEGERLLTPANMYLFHMKYCDAGLYSGTMDRRNAVAGATGASVAEAGIGRHWFAEARGEDRALFEGFAAQPRAAGFDMAPYREAMHASWQPREGTPFHQFDRTEYDEVVELPERFFGLV